MDNKYTSLRLVFGLILVPIMALNATIWRVNNTPGINASYSDMASAISGASVDDTLYVEGSLATYGAVLLNKRLTIIGPGYLLGVNDTTMAFQQPATLSSLRVTAAGSTVMGLFINNTATSPVFALSIEASNVTMLRNYLRKGNNGASGDVVQISSGLSGVSLAQNLVENTGTSLSFTFRGINFLGAGTNCIISNNIILTGAADLNGGSMSGDALVLATGGAYRVNFNTIRGNCSFFNAQVTGNILIRGLITTSPANPNIVQNNLSNQSQFGVLQGNQSLVDMTTGMFTMTGLVTEDRHYRLASASPAITAGPNGANAGSYGGFTPYVLSGMPPIPSIFAASIPGAANTATGVPVNQSSISRN
jgi:hypothetical protein